MQNDNISPIHHGAVSGATHTVAGAAAGAVKTGVGTWLSWMGATTLIGAAIGLTIATGGFGAGIAWSSVAWVVGGAAVGGGLGSLVAAPIAGAGALFGAFKGGSNASQRVNQERGAANVLSAQVEAYQAQAMAAQQQPTNIYAPSAANNNYPTASTMNQAGTKIQADMSQDLGTLNGQAIAAAR